VSHPKKMKKEVISRPGVGAQKENDRLMHLEMSFEEVSGDPWRRFEESIGIKKSSNKIKLDPK